MYAFYLFLLTLWWSKNWEEASACPYIPIEELVQGSQVISKAILTILFQVFGGLVIFRYIQYMWALELTDIHRGKAYEDCAADLNVRIRKKDLIQLSQRDYVLIVGVCFLEL